MNPPQSRHSHVGTATARWITVSAGWLIAAAMAVPSVTAQSAPPATTQPAPGRPPVISPTAPKPADYPYWETVRPGEYRGFNQRASLRQRGKEVYAKYCVGCHGVNGDGKGVAARRLITQPRDFTTGTYKFRSTDSSSLPLESDLHRTIRNGLARVSMPAFPKMPEGDVVAVVEYIKGFYPDWEDDKEDRVRIPAPVAPSDLGKQARIQRGRIVYVAMQCGSCHGADGTGRDAEKKVFDDAWGNPQKPFDFTRGRLKSGDDPEDVYRTFHTGLISIMPAYGPALLASANIETLESQTQLMLPGERATLAAYTDQFPQTADDFRATSDAERVELGERNSWDLVAYIISLRKSTSTASAVLGDGP